MEKGRNNGALVVLRLDQISKMDDCYVGFNRADGINEDTRADRNMVTIVRKENGDPEEYGLSWKIASLMPGKQHENKKFNGKSDVIVLFIKLDNGDATIRVIADEGPMPPP
jgi:hypothetical protein